MDSLTPNQVRYSQFFTPLWATESIVELIGVNDEDRVLEPSCGDGAFLKALPDEVEAIGVEIDPVMAELARQSTGRHIITGDFLEVDIPMQPTLVLGNPPYKVKTVKSFLDKSYSLLPDGGRVVFLLSVHILQTPKTMDHLLSNWGIDHCLVPRTLFNRAIRPLSLLSLTKGATFCRGMALYRQALFINRLPTRAKTAATNGQRSVWLRVVTWAMDQAGGEATLTQLYELVGQRRPTENKWWQAKCRQVLQQHFQPVGRGRWRRKQV